MRKIPDSPDIDSSGETGKTPSGPILQDRPGPEMEITACPPVPPPSSNSPPLQIGQNREITHGYPVFIGSHSGIAKTVGEGSVIHFSPDPEMPILHILKTVQF